MINAAERLAKRVRAAMGGHNNDDLPVTQCVINMREEVVSLQAECEKLRKDAAAALSGLPDSLPMEPYQTVDRGSPHYKAGWNACRRAILAALEKMMEDPIHDQ